ncbi:MAG: hypothetical protein ACKO3V_01895 [Pirellula sp.]
MSAIAIETVSFDGGNFEGARYVQQLFDWDAPCVPSVPTPTVAIPAAASPAPATARRGRCEHVGSVMGAVLSKYGLGIDDLLRAIEERQAQVGVSR